MAFALNKLMQELEKILHSHQQILSLKEKVAQLLDFIEDSPGHSSSIIDIEEKIKDAVCDGEDTIDSLLETATMHTELQKMIEEFDSILGSVSKIKNRGKAIEYMQPTGSSLPAGSSTTVSSKKSTMVGFEQDFQRIMDRVIAPSSKLDIISIVGMGGIGKTTLARNVYDTVDFVFDAHAWVTISRRYYFGQILKDLLRSFRLVEEESYDHEVQLDKLKENVYKSLKGRKYLIVMDDVWDTKFWDDVRNLLPDDNQGSRIILITRQSQVAKDASPGGYIHYMSLLGSEESWEMLRTMVFGEETCPCEMETLGKKIACDCKGLPLAIAVIGGLLSKQSKTPNSWLAVSRNLKPFITGADDQIVEMLSLSYDHLPLQLKSCFLYMGVFPEDFEIFASQLTMLWIAEGFVEPHGTESSEKMAEKYLNDLADRSLILVRRRDHYGNIKTCSIHDLLRDLCIKKAEEEKFLRVIRPLPDRGTNSCRVSVQADYFDPLPPIRDPTSCSLLYFIPRFRCNQLFFPFITRFKLLKVLDILTVFLADFPCQIFELVNLRYLAFVYRGSRDANLPASISNLHNLQTLILFSTMVTVVLPLEIWKLQQLRHLLLNGARLPYPYSSLDEDTHSSCLEYLTTLSFVSNFRCTNEIIEIMPNLKKLKVFYSLTKFSPEISSYGFNNFSHLEKLETLKCSFTMTHQNVHSIQMRFVLPHSLRKLRLDDVCISWDKMSMLGSLDNLQVLKLVHIAFEGPIWEPNEGEFLQLTYLHIQMNALIQWKAKSTHFPQLERLVLNFFYQLEGIPLEIGNISTLRVLEVYRCSHSAMDSAMLIGEEQRSYGNEDLEVLTNEEFAESRRKKSFRQVIMDYQKKLRGEEEVMQP